MIDVPFAALLLAGGRSRRMGCDKALLDWHGQPMWMVQMAKLRALNPARLMIACRENQNIGRAVEVEWLYDPQGDELGPMGAIHRAWEVVKMPLLVLAVDMPWMTTSFMRDELLGGVVNDGGFFIETDHGPEPLAGVYMPLMLERMRRSIEVNQLNLQRFVLEFGLARVRCAELHEVLFFSNTNTPAEWLHEKDRSVRPASPNS